MKRLATPATRWQCFAPQAYTRSEPQQPTGRPAVDSIGIDLHKRESQLCIITDDGELIERRIVTSRDRFRAVLGERPPARIRLEASTESEWVARHLESLGHVVIVADPGFAAMYATRSKRVKTDKRGARTLCEALRLGAYREIHRASDEQRQVRALLGVRDALVRTRTRYVAIRKAFVRREGLRIPTGTCSSSSHRCSPFGHRSTRSSRRPTRVCSRSRTITPWWRGCARCPASAR
jgi:hypothetical protein